MAETFRLMCVLAHPDDESLGLGGVLARYAAEGVETYLITATRGERGWFGPEDEYPGLARLGQIREQELRAAGKVLGIRDLFFLDYIDGDLDAANHNEAVARIVRLVRRIKPQVVITFGPDGAYGHPDHIAICQYTTAAMVRAAEAGYTHPQAGDDPPYAVSKLYYYAPTRQLSGFYTEIFGEISMPVDGVDRKIVNWEDWNVTTTFDAGQYWRTIWEAVSQHKTQLPNYGKLARLTEEEHRKLWGYITLYRAYSLVNGGRRIEADIFEGLR